MKVPLAFAQLLILGGFGLTQTAVMKKTDRQVFVSAQTLAVSCQEMKDAVGRDYLLDPSKTYKLTTSDMAAVGRCTGYIEGVVDEFRERVGSHYQPVPAGRGEIPILIEAFLKRVAEHPEEADFAASTVLHEADNDVLHYCGDCGLGMIARPNATP
jgi:Rap1a immunity proteins